VCQLVCDIVNLKSVHCSGNPDINLGINILSPEVAMSIPIF
jgi:hypothetical protein